MAQRLIDPLTHPDYFEIARAVCTRAELDALILRDRRGLGTRSIGVVLHISRAAVRERLASADRKLAAAFAPEDTQTLF